jgi:hypothetical protein
MPTLRHVSWQKTEHVNVPAFGRLFTQVLQPSSVFDTLVLQFIQKRKGLCVSGSKYKQGSLKFLYNAMVGVTKGMCEF